MPKNGLVAVTSCVALALALTACGRSAETGSPAAEASRSSAAPAPETNQDSLDSSGREVAGTKVRFSDGSTTVEVTLGEETSAVRDFVSMLPLTLELEDYIGREKISTLPRELRYGDTKGTAPEEGDLLYYAPWGNLGFFYATDEPGHSDDTLHLGTYNATRDELDHLEGRVRVEAMD